MEKYDQKMFRCNGVFTGVVCYKWVELNIDDLKRLVESHELVEIYTRRFNGDAEWFFVSEYCKKNRISPFFSENYNKASGIYKQAIADVESCQ